MDRQKACRETDREKPIGEYLKSIVAIIPKMLVLAGNQSLVAQALIVYSSD
jgi:hypothetical protein